METEQAALRLHKAHREDGKGEAEGNYLKCTDSQNKEFHQIDNGKFNEHRVYEIIPETLSIYTGLTAEWVAEGIDPRIWSGDLFERDNYPFENKKWKVIYKNAAFYVQRIDDEEIEDLLFDFISDNVYTKIGSIHDETASHEN